MTKIIQCASVKFLKNIFNEYCVKAASLLPKRPDQTDEMVSKIRPNPMQCMDKSHKTQLCPTLIHVNVDSYSLRLRMADRSPQAGVSSTRRHPRRGRQHAEEERGDKYGDCATRNGYEMMTGHASVDLGGRSIRRPCGQ